MLCVLELVYMHRMCAEACGGQNRASNPLELELQIVVNCLVCAGSQTWILCVEVKGQPAVSSFLLLSRVWRSEFTHRVTSLARHYPFVINQMHLGRSWGVSRQNPHRRLGLP